MLVVSRFDGKVAAAFFRAASTGPAGKGDHRQKAANGTFVHMWKWEMRQFLFFHHILQEDAAIVDHVLGVFFFECASHFIEIIETQD